jgi:hypothetical protein
MPRFREANENGACVAQGMMDLVIPIQSRPETLDSITVNKILIEVEIILAIPRTIDPEFDTFQRQGLN